MNFKIGAYLTILAGAMMFLSACEGGNDITAPGVVVTSNNPVLVNYSTTVIANFSNYTSLVKFGSPITFSVVPSTASFGHLTKGTASFSHFSTVAVRTVPTDVGGIAAVSIRSPSPGRFIVSASSPVIGGSTTVSFIDQPASMQVRVGLRQPLTKVGTITFDLVSTQPAPVFVNFSGIQSPFIWNEDTDPILPPGGVPDDGAYNLIIGSLLGINMGALKPLFRYDFVPIPPSVPTFTIANVIANTADVNATPLFPSLYIVSTKYFDAAGNELFY